MAGQGSATRDESDDPREETQGSGTEEPAVAVAPQRIGFEPPRGVTRIEWRPGLAHFAVELGEEGRGLAAVFRPLTEAGVSVDMIKLLPPGIRFSLSQNQAESAAEMLRGLDLDFTVTPECAVLTVYAPDMRSLPGIMATVVGVLDNNGVRVLSTDDSYNEILCVIDRKDGPRACRALADEFGLHLQDRAGPAVEW
ncbi:MAG: ACT domain-containing protein [Armatimonadota bacterium]|jgi:aspartate kinase